MAEKLRWQLVLIPLSLLAFATVGCGKKDDQPTSSAPAPSASTAPADPQTKATQALNDPNTSASTKAYISQHMGAINSASKK